MAAPCSTCPQARKQKKTASIHGKVAIREGWGHAYTDGSPAGLQGVSAGRRAHLASEAHAKAYEHVAGECIFFAGGAPMDCYGPITPGHIVPRSVAGSLEEADRWPVAPQCALHNREVDANPELRTWASEHTFRWFDGREYRYRYDRPTFERELLNVPASTTSDSTK